MNLYICTCYGLLCREFPGWHIFSRSNRNCHDTVFSCRVECIKLCSVQCEHLEGTWYLYYNIMIHPIYHIMIEMKCLQIVGYPRRREQTVRRPICSIYDFKVRLVHGLRGWTYKLYKLEFIFVNACACW